MSHKGSHRAPMFDPTEAERRRREREDMRQVTRELHEAAQNARDAARETRETVKEARAARAELTSEVQTIVTDAQQGLKEWFLEAKKGIDRGVAEFVKNAEDEIMSYFAEALGADARTADEFIEVILNRTREFVKQEFENLGEKSQDIIREKAMRNLASAQIFVTNDPALAPKGSVIIDGRG